MIFKWKPKVSIPIKAQDAGEEIIRLTEEHDGSLQPEDIVKAAKLKRSPLHPVFEWDDKEAARVHRLDQARYLLRSIVVVTNEGSEEAEDEIVIRAFIHSEEEEAYLTIYRAMSDDNLRQELIARAWKELQNWKKRYEELEEFARVVAVISSEKPSVGRKKVS